MSEKNFCYWLQGFFEMTEADTLSKKQILMIKEHLNLVFTKVTGDVKQPLDDLAQKTAPSWINPRVIFDADEPVCKTVEAVTQKRSLARREQRYCQQVTPVHSCSLETIGFK